MRKLYEYIFPKYSRLPLLITLAFDIFVYYGTKVLQLFQELKPAWLLPIDGKIPFVPAFISFYVLAYVQWFVCIIIIARDNKESCYRFLSCDIMGKIITLIIFILLPLTMGDARPQVTEVTDIWTFITKIVFDADTPTNLFPSLHCFESWIIARCSYKLTKMPKWYFPFQIVFTLFVFASTVLVKQHVFLDIIGGVALAELVLFVSKRFNTGRVYEKLEKFTLKK